MGDKILYIVRGIPGSGKSTFAKTLGGIHWEADMFFTDPFTGDYNFDPSKIKSAHEWCQLNVKENMMESEDKIIVSNTFTQEWEMQPYFDMAKEYGYKVFSVIVENRHDGINLHNVPEDKIEIMRDRFEIKLS